jgi:hypothetical protein
VLTANRCDVTTRCNEFFAAVHPVYQFFKTPIKAAAGSNSVKNAVLGAQVLDSALINRDFLLIMVNSSVPQS